jgi:hypothetical protein
MVRKGHIAAQTIAVHCSYSPKRHLFRPEFEQIDEQMTLSYASRGKDAASAIIFL